MALISRYHTEASGNTIFAANYNGEFDNIINNGLIPSGIVADGAANVTAMRAVSNPGAVGAEVLPVSLSDEIRQIHYVIKALSGGAQWYDVSATVVPVKGPASSTDNAVARFDSTTGKLIQNSGVIIDDSNNVTGLANVTCTGLSATGNVTLGDAAGDSVTITAATSISVSAAFGNASHDVVTRATGTSVGVRGVGISSSSSTFSSSSGTYVDVTNLSVTLTTSGRPVIITLIPDTTTGGGTIAAVENSGGGTTVRADFKALRDSTDIGEATIQNVVAGNGSNNLNLFVPGSSLLFLDAVGAGTYVYKLQGKIATGDVFQVNNCKLIAYEL